MAPPPTTRIPTGAATPASTKTTKEAHALSDGMPKPTWRGAAQEDCKTSKRLRNGNMVNDAGAREHFQAALLSLVWRHFFLNGVPSTLGKKDIGSRTYIMDRKQGRRNICT